MNNPGRRMATSIRNLTLLDKYSTLAGSPKVRL
jgi:hypothetical protein